MKNEVIKNKSTFTININGELYKCFIQSDSIDVDIKNKWYIKLSIYKQYSYKFLWFKINTYRHLGEPYEWFKNPQHFFILGESYIDVKNIKTFVKNALMNIEYSDQNKFKEQKRKNNLKIKNHIE
jgi:hypothetical protein